MSTETSRETGPGTDLIGLARRAIGGLARGEGMALCGVVLDPGLSWHEPGRNLVAGTYSGCEEVAGHLFARMRELTAGWFRVEIETITEDAGRVVAICSVLAERGHRRLRSRDVCVLEVRNGLVSAGRVYHADQHAWDRFWS